MAHNARYARLAIEYTKLMNLAARSWFIKIRPIETQPGWPPEKYIISYQCRGIASIDEHELPRVSELHQVSIYMGSEYPLKEPYLRWLTPIWHPNIGHEEPHHVCTNNVQNWFAAKPLAELVFAMGEMVQYKHYHAKWTPPYPLDRAAADWVLEVAEPQGILGPDKPFDDRPLLKPQRMRQTSNAASLGGSVKTGKGIVIGRSPIANGVGPDDKAIKSLKGVASELTENPEGRRTSVIRFGKRIAQDLHANTLEPPGPPETRLLGPLPRQSDDNGIPGADLYSVEIYKDGQLQRVAQFSQSVLSIGRGSLGASVDVVLDGDQTMSRLHIIIERDESGAFWVTAKGQNPVTVAGRSLPRERSIGIERGELIQICSYSLKLQ